MMDVFSFMGCWFLGQNSFQPNDEEIGSKNVIGTLGDILFWKFSDIIQWKNWKMAKSSICY